MASNSDVPERAALKPQSSQLPIESNVQCGSSATEVCGTTVTGSKSDFYEWTARVRCNTSEFNDSFWVYIFLGDVPDNPNEWDGAPSHVESKYFMTCSAYQGVAVGGRDQGFAHLNDFITDHAGLGPLSDEVVIPYLKNNLHWRTKEVDGTVIPSKDFTSLEVVVIGTPYYRVPESPLPQAGKTKVYTDVTAGRPGGYRFT